MTSSAARGEPTLVVGAGGLLGSAVVRAVRARGGQVRTAAVPWHDVAAASEELAQAVDGLLTVAGGGRWHIAWCAGAGVTASSATQIADEVTTLRRCVDHMLEHSGPSLQAGRVFFASSAGALYAGSSGAPFDESTTPVPLSAYGRGKLQMEEQVTRLATAGGARVMVGRLSNLYGPGQDLAKAQGLISQLCRAQLTGQPVGLYVSLDTVRDYLFVDDAAGLVLDGLSQLDAVCPPAGVVTKILAAQRSASIAAVLGELRRLSRRKPVVRLSASPQAAVQARDLRFRSTVWPELDRRPLTPLPVGIHATSHDLAARIMAGGLARGTHPDGTQASG